VGVDNWVMALSADHGVSDIPELRDPPVSRLGADDVREVLQIAQRTLTSQGTAGDVANRLREALEPLSSVRRVFTFDELEVDQPADSFAQFFANSHVRERPVNQLGPFEIYIQWREHSLVAPSWVTRRQGSDHRSAFYFDRWVPMIFYGAGVESGWSDEAVATVDIAPTLAALAGIQAPNDLDGEVVVSGTP
jgi:arylsulfatase A-like enzyme